MFIVSPTTGRSPHDNHGDFTGPAATEHFRRFVCGGPRRERVIDDGNMLIREPCPSCGGHRASDVVLSLSWRQHALFFRLSSHSQEGAVGDRKLASSRLCHQFGAVDSAF